MNRCLFSNIVVKIATMKTKQDMFDTFVAITLDLTAAMHILVYKMTYCEHEKADKCEHYDL